MDIAFSFSDLQHLILVKMCFFGFIVFGIVAVYKKWNVGWFLLGFGIFNALAYFFLVQGTLLSFWGLTADEQTIAAMYQSFAHGSLFSDFAYFFLPPFYPPLWFQVFGLFGRVFSLNGVQMAKLASFVTIGLFPVFYYVVQTFLFKHNQSLVLENEIKSKKGVQDISRIVALFSTVLLFILIDWDAIITKPYEFVSAALVIVWATAFLVDLSKEYVSKKRVLLYGLSGGMLFLLFYFWFFLVAIGIALFNLFSEKAVSLRRYGILIKVALIALAVGSLYWVPLAHAYLSLGAENFQSAFFVLDWLNTKGPLLDVSFRSLVLLIGLVTLIVYRKRVYIRALLALFVAGYAWQIMGMLTLIFFQVSLQEDKGLFLFNTIVLGLAAGYGLGVVYGKCKNTYTDRSLHISLAVVGVLILSPFMLFGVFADQPTVQAVRVRANTIRPGMTDLISYLETQNVSEKIVLTTGIPELHAFVAFSEFVYFNQHNSHPAANFSSRLSAVHFLGLARDAESFYDIIDHEQIDEFIFYKGEEKPEFYRIYVTLDNFPHLSREEFVDIPKNFFVEPYVNVLYENAYFIVYGRN